MKYPIHRLESKNWQICINGAIVECHDSFEHAKNRANIISVSRRERVDVVLTHGVDGDAIYTVE